MVSMSDYSNENRARTMEQMKYIFDHASLIVLPEFLDQYPPNKYYAFYQFKDVATLRARLDSPDFKVLVADFDQAWPQVARTRDLIEAVQEA